MSREEAHRRTDRPPHIPEEAVPPRFPLFTAGTDTTAGVIRTQGHVDAVCADDLCRAVTALRRLGHRRISVELGRATLLDDDARALLADHARRLHADGVDLRISDSSP